MNKDLVMLSSSPVVGKSLKEIYELGLNRQYAGWWATIEPHPTSEHGVMISPVLAISRSIDSLAEFCRERGYLSRVTYEPIQAEKPVIPSLD